MNKLVEEQLKKLNLSDYTFDFTCNDFIIPKMDTGNVQNKLQLNHSYTIELSDYILNEPPNFTLSVNWNKGIKPRSKLLNCTVTQILGKMIKIDAVGEYNDSYIALWLPISSIKIIQEI